MFSVVVLFLQGWHCGFPQTSPHGTGKAKEWGIVLSMGWPQYPLIHQSSVCSGEGPCPCPWDWRGPHCSQALPDLGTRAEPWHGHCSAQVEGGTVPPLPLRVAPVPGCPGSSSSPGNAPGTAQLAQPSPGPCSIPAMSES